MPASQPAEWVLASPSPAGQRRFPGTSMCLWRFALTGTGTLRRPQPFVVAVRYGALRHRLDRTQTKEAC